MTAKFGWGHININVSNLEAAVAFYRKLGFEPFLPAIPYLNLDSDNTKVMDDETTEALGLPSGASGRACIMQLDDGFPKIDLTEFEDTEQDSPLQNKDLGLVRLCLVSQDLARDYAALSEAGVPFLSPPRTCHQRMAEVATCVDPDGTLIELLEVHLENWPSIPGFNE